MTKAEVYERLNGVFRRVFEDESICVDETTTSADIADWDSLEHVNLLFEIEQEFQVKFGMRQVTGLKNVGEIADFLLRKGS